jgi:hypothetical protein
MTAGRMTGCGFENRISRFLVLTSVTVRQTHTLGTDDCE